MLLCIALGRFSSDFLIINNSNGISPYRQVPPDSNSEYNIH